MPLSKGDRLGPYEIVGLLGQGGMGEVYRAHDSRLGRDVAIKKSLSTFGQRDEREARAVAALNHPNICTLHDVGPDYLVMELVEGSSPTGPCLPPTCSALPSRWRLRLMPRTPRASSIAILKPANVKITQAGVVKVLAFGLAKLVPGASLGDPSSSTLSLTEAGTTMGTPAYMAPEQAAGREAGTRSDVWAFGLLLYELLTGSNPFRRESLQATLTAVLTEDPDWRPVPPRLQRLIRACLKKDPRERLAAISDWRWLVDDAQPEPHSPATRARAKRPWAVAAVIFAVAAALLVTQFRRGGDQPPTIRFEVPIPGGVGQSTMFALSPDGRALAIAASEDGQIHLRVRSLDTLEARLLSGTEGARYPFWKPDGTEIGFVAGGQLKSVPVAGGPGDNRQRRRSDGARGHVEPARRHRHIAGS